MPKHTKHVTTVVSKRVFCVCLLVYCYLVLAVVMDLRPISDEEDVQTSLDMLESHKRRVNLLRGSGNQDCPTGVQEGKRKLGCWQDHTKTTLINTGLTITDVKELL